MSGAMRKMGVYLGLVEDTERYEEYDDEPQAGASSRAASPAATGGNVASLSERRRPIPQQSAGSPVLTAHVAEMSKIATVQPRAYNDARTVGENYRAGTPVIMNLSEMDDSDAKRLVDFAAGLVFAVNGSIERVTSKVFLLSPPNVSVAAEDKERMAENGFFNQS